MKDPFKNLKNGQAVSGNLVILSIGDQLIGANKDKFGIEVIKDSILCPNGFLMFTPAHLNRIARKAGANGINNLRSSHKSSFEDSVLKVSGFICKAGEQMHDWEDEGQPEFVDEDGNSEYTKDWFRRNVTLTSIELAADAKDYIARINEQLDLEDARAERAEQNKALKALKRGKKLTGGISFDSDEADDNDDDEDDDDDSVEELFGEEVETPKPKAKAKAKAKKA